MSYRRVNIAQPSQAAPVSRRDFLRLRTSKGKRVLELSCESLFMRHHDARSGAAGRQVSNHDDLSPPAAARAGHDTQAPDALFTELDRQLAGVDELRVLEREWLDDGSFGRAVLARVEAFRQRGGRVEFAVLPAELPSGGGATQS